MNKDTPPAKDAPSGLHAKWDSSALQGGEMVLVSVSITPDLVKGEVAIALGDLQKKIVMRGFRPGKVPQALVRKVHGQAVLAGVQKRLFEDSYTAALPEAYKKHGIDPKSNPKIEVTRFEFSEEKGLSYEMLLKMPASTKAVLASPDQPPAAGTVVNLTKKD